MNKTGQGFLPQNLNFIKKNFVVVKLLVRSQRVVKLGSGFDTLLYDLSSSSES